MIEVSHLTKSFGDIKAVSDATFTVNKGQIVGFLGANGAGKTTTMDIICGCSGADQGSVKVAGYDITEAPLEAKKRLGYLPEVPPLHNEMIVDDYIEYAGKLRGVPRNELPTRKDRIIEKLSLGDVRYRIVGNLSKGYRQRVGLAQAIIHDPEVLVLDEPTEGLDPNQIAQIRDLIRSLAGEHTIILSSHILSEVQNTCEHVIIIHQGRIIEQGAYSELAAKLEAGRIYQLKVARETNRLMQSLSNIENLTGLKNAVNGSEALEFALKSNDDESTLDQVAKTVIDGGHGLRELALKTKSLEEVFFQLTK